MAKKKIIVIDDVELNRVILKEAFHKEFETIEASDGAEGLKKIIKHQNELAAIFLDIIMPEVDGFSVLHEMNVRALIQKIPVFLITTDANDYVVKKAYDYGAVDVIPKPFNMLIIKRRVENIINYFEAKCEADADVVEKDNVIRVTREDLTNAGLIFIGGLCEVIESRSKEDSEHIAHVKEIAYLIAQEIAKEHAEYGLKEDMIAEIASASVAHDIGKIFVPDTILKKPLAQGRLTAEEMQTVKGATLAGVNFLNTLKGIPEPFFTFTKEICRSHMERWDGKGYPEGLSGSQIPLSAQIAGVAEVYDVLVSKRVYKKAYSHQEALKMINSAECGTFNPDILRSLNAVSEEIKKTVYNAE